MRLNANAEKYVAGWLLDIKENRGYEKADINADGIIDYHEDDNLNVGFDHNTDYEYLAQKIVTAHSFVGKRTYQKFSDTSDHLNSSNILNNQALKFKNTIEKELIHTIKLDKDKDGTITLKEGMVDFTPKDKSVEKHLVDNIQSNHGAWVIKNNIILDKQNIMIRDIPTSNIITEKERKEALKAFEENHKVATKWFNEHKEMFNDMSLSFASEEKLKENLKNAKEICKKNRGKNSC